MGFLSKIGWNILGIIAFLLALVVLGGGVLAFLSLAAYLFMLPGLLIENYGWSSTIAHWTGWGLLAAYIIVSLAILMAIFSEMDEL